MTEFKIKGDVEQLIQATTVHINEKQNNQPLTNLQWQTIKERIEELKQYQFAEPKEVYRHLKCMFGVNKTRDIAATRYPEVMAEIQKFIDAKLADTRQSFLIKSLLSLPYEQGVEAKNYTKKHYGTMMFKLLTPEQLAAVWAHFENYESPQANIRTDSENISASPLVAQVLNTNSESYENNFNASKTRQEHDKRAFQLALILTGFAVIIAAWVVLSGYF
ncbi:hypothetical protein [Paralysiella testudinis]|uniref:Uncharacterized protein n=1 Tax=Paralysiella testudinis TaxID=2809020 RepID=A0A892ZH73_9NEIS|nr:hypothetical protein [Paralysiella testudinis]QRQ81096.1 hypothetical protein JQU52_10220 [Paralysiella testudinis]